MQYNVYVDSAHPACFLFLVSYSESMQTQFDADSGMTKLQASINVVNSFIDSIIIHCQSGDVVKPYFHIGAFGYYASNSDFILNNLLPTEEAFATSSFLSDHFFR